MAASLSFVFVEPAYLQTKLPFIRYRQIKQSSLVFSSVNAEMLFFAINQKSSLWFRIQRTRDLRAIL